MAADDGVAGRANQKNHDWTRGGVRVPVRSGVYGLAALSALMLTDAEESEERESRQEAETMGAIAGVAIGVGMMVADKLREEKELEEIFQQEEQNEYVAQQDIWQQMM